MAEWAGADGIVLDKDSSWFIRFLMLFNSSIDKPWISDSDELEIFSDELENLTYGLFDAFLPPLHETVHVISKIYL